MRNLINLIFIAILLVSTAGAISQTTGIDVIETRNITLLFTPVNEISKFNEVADRNAEFLRSTYPISDNGLNLIKDDSTITVSENLSSNFLLRNAQLLNIRYKILSSVFLSKQKFTSAIGIVKEGYLFPIDSGVTGINFDLGKSDVILIDETQLKTTAHEVGHTFELCDEYNITEWNRQNKSIFGGCPNGDINKDGSLDQTCLDNDGCPTSTFPELFVDYGNINESRELRNMMGGTDTPDFSTSPPSEFETWISKDSFNALLNRFDINSNFTTPLITYVNHPFPYIIIRIFYEKNGSFEVMNSYQLESGFVNNASTSKGNFSIELTDSKNAMISNISFEPNFVITAENGRTIDINETFLIFALPINENLSQMVLKNNTNILQEINRTPNTPNVQFISNLGEDIFSNEIINISWNSSDLDGDNLAYAVLFSTDNGLNYATLEIDYNTTEYTINSSNLQDCDLCRIKVLVTDGINTNSSVTDTFIISNSLKYRFFIKNDSGANTAWFDDTGNLFLKGKCSLQPACNASQNSFIIANFTDDTVAYINSTGDLCIERGSCSNMHSSTCNPTRDAFIIQNSSRVNISYIDFNGNICLTGELYQSNQP